MQAQASASGIPFKRLGNTFASFDPRRNDMREAYDLTRAVADGRAWCCAMLGDSNTGKTHLAIAAMHAFRDGGLMRSRFWSVPDFLEWIRQKCVREHWPTDELLHDYLHLDVLLVLDDLGVENATDWAYEQLYRVINARRDNELPTIVTSNLSLDAVDSRFVARLKSGLVVCKKSEEKQKK